MSNAEITIRRAKKEDMVQVCNMIKELAIFENLEDQVKITPEMLIEDAFSPQPAFGCLVADLENGELVGYAIFYNAYSTWRGKFIFLEDIYVKPLNRKNGIGKNLFLAVSKIAYDLPSKRMDFHVLSWNPASNFYESLGAENLSTTEKWQLYRLNEESLNKLFA